MNEGSFISLYSPENIPLPLLKKIFVGRGKLLEKIVTDIGESAKQKKTRSLLILGPRGYGKSTLITLVYYELQEKYCDFIIPVKLNEEEYSISSVTDFLLRVITELDRADCNKFLEQIEYNEDFDGEKVQHNAAVLLQNISKKENKILLVLAENLHQIIRQMGDEGKELRAFIHESEQISFLFSSPILPVEISEYNKPLFQQFDTYSLEELTQEQSKDLLLRLADTDGNEVIQRKIQKNLNKFDGIYSMTGGSPRLILFIYRLICTDNFGDIESVFLKLLDDHTPYYQEIFDRIQGDKRKIMDSLLLSDEPLTPTEISQKARIPLANVNTNLRRLEMERFILSYRLGKRTSYEVRERLFRFWRVNRQTFGRYRIKLFIEFLSLWFDPEELKQQCLHDITRFRSGDMSVLENVTYRYPALPLEKREDLRDDVVQLLDYVKNDEIKALITRYIPSKSQKSKPETVSPQDDLKSLSVDDLTKFIDLNPSNTSAYFNRGLSKSKLKDYDGALLDYSKVIDLDPSNTSAYFNRGLSKSYLKQYDAAIEDYSKAIDLDPSDGSAYTNRGTAKYYLKQYDAAIEDYSKVIDLDPSDASAYYNRGTAKYYLKQYDAAIEDYSKAIELDPSYARAYNNRGLSKSYLKQYDAAIEDYSKAIDLDPSDASAYNNRGTAKSDLKQYDAAIEDYSKAIDLDPSSVHAYNNRGLSKSELKQYDDAIIDYSKVIDMDPLYVRAYLNRGNAKLELKQYDAAIEDYSKAIDLDPSSVHAYFNRGNAKSELKLYDDAIIDYSKGLELDPLDTSAYYNRGNTKSILKLYNDAIIDYSKAIELDPTDTSAYVNRGNVKSILKLYNDAIIDYSKAIELDLSLSGIYFNRGYAKSELKQYDAAIEDYSKAIELDPSYAYAYFTRGLLKLKLKQYDDAIIDYSKTIELDPSYVSAYFTRGIVKSELKLYDDAIYDYSKTIELDPTYVYAYYYRAESEMYCSRFNEALSDIDQAISIADNPSFEFLKARILYKLKEKQDAIKLIQQIPSSPSELIDDPLDTIFFIALEELKTGNNKNFEFLLNKAYLISNNNSKALKRKMIQLLKDLIDTHNPDLIEESLQLIITATSNKYEIFIRPMLKALRIIQNEDTDLYYRELQSEERQIVANIVKNITKSSILVPKEFKNS